MSTVAGEYYDLSDKLDKVLDLNAPPLEELPACAAPKDSGRASSSRVSKSWSVRVSLHPLRFMRRRLDFSLEPFCFTGLGFREQSARCRGRRTREPVSEHPARQDSFNLKVISSYSRPHIHQVFRKVADVCGVARVLHLSGPARGLATWSASIAKWWLTRSLARRIRQRYTVLTAPTTALKVNTHITKVVGDSFAQEEISLTRASASWRIWACAGTRREAQSRTFSPITHLSPV